MIKNMTQAPEQVSVDCSACGSEDGRIGECKHHCTISSDCHPDNDHDNEELRLVEQCQTRPYALARDWLLWVMKFSTMRLIADQAATTQDVKQSATANIADDREAAPQRPLRNLLYPAKWWLREDPTPPDNTSSSSHDGRHPDWRNISTALLFGYIFIKHLLASVLLYKRDSIQAHLAPSWRNGTPHTATCARSEDLYFRTEQELAQLAELKALNQWLMSLGAVALSAPAFMVTLDCFCCLMPAIVYFGLLLGPFIYKLRVDCLCFLLDPLGERKRISGEISNILCTLQSLSSRPLSAGSRASSLKSVRYLKLLAEIEQFKLAYPYSVGVEWHRRLARLVRNYLSSMFVTGYSIAIIVAVWVIYADCRSMVRIRREELECQRWQPNGIRIAGLVDQLHLEKLPESPEHLAAYELAATTTRNQQLALVWIEMGWYMSLWRLAYTVEVLASAIVLIRWGALLTLVILASTMEKVAWLKQLNEQMSSMAEEAAKRQYRSNRRLSVASLAAATTTSPCNRRWDDETKREACLLKSLTVAYINYELFRRQHSAYRTVSGYALKQLFVISVLHCAIQYSVAINVTAPNRLLVLIWCFVFYSLININLWACSLKFKQTDRAVRHIVRTLAFCATNSTLYSSVPLKLWRRQLLTEIEIRKLYASKVLIFPISYKNVIGVNAYAVALILVFIRVWNIEATIRS